MFAPILRDIVKLGWPVLIAQVAVMVNGVIDTVMAGRLGAADLAAVGIGSSIYISIFITAMGVLIALTPVAAQLYGAGKLAEIGEEVRQCLWLGAVLVLITFTLIYFPDPFLALAQTAPEVEEKTRSYLRSIAFGIPALLMFRVFYSFTTAVSKPRVIMLLNLVGLALKIPLNLVFMHGYLGMPALGGPGCAVSTSITAWLLATAAWLVCRFDPAYRPFHVFARWSWPDWRGQLRLVHLGLPIGFNFLVDVTSFTFMALFIARLGTANSGGHQIAANLTGLIYMMPLAMASASGVLTGQAIGAGDRLRARRTGFVGIGSGLFFACLVAFAVWFGREAIAGLYTRDAEVRTVAITLLAYVATYHLFDALSAVAVSVLRGYKKTVVPMFCNIVALWGLGLGGGYLLAFGSSTQMGAAGFWIAGTAGVLTGSVLIIVYFLRVSRVAQ